MNTPILVIFKILYINSVLCFKKLSLLTSKIFRFRYVPYLTVNLGSIYVRRITNRIFFLGVALIKSFIMKKLIQREMKKFMRLQIK